MDARGKKWGKRGEDRAAARGPWRPPSSSIRDEFDTCIKEFRTKGAVPRCAKDEWAWRLRAVAPATDRAALAPERLPWCDVCNNLKPPRTRLLFLGNYLFAPLTGLVLRLRGVQ